MRLYTCLLALLFCSASLRAQLVTDEVVSDQTNLVYRTYTSTLYTSQQTSLGLQDYAFHQEIYALLPKFKYPGEWEEITIPVVFHVLYTSQSDLVTQQQISEQLNSLNNDFAGLTEAPEGDLRDPKGEFAKVKADTKIRFCFPEPSIADGLTTAVDFYLLKELSADNVNAIKVSATGLAAKNPEKYLNIWVVPLPGSNAGFAQLPKGSGGTDGIVINSRFFGNSGTAVAPFNQGKTLTHLIGSYLGLTPIWGDTTNCSDDGIDDTPVHNAPNFGNPGPGHVSTCPGYPAEMTMNFMDANDDEYLYMFTNGQAAWMRAVLSKDGPRGNLVLSKTECSQDKIQLPYTAPYNLAEANTAPYARVFPNPAKSLFTVELLNGDDDLQINSVRVYDLKKEVILDQPAGSNKGKGPGIFLNGTAWPRGVYYLEVVLNDGKSLYQRIVLQ